MIRSIIDCKKCLLHKEIKESYVLCNRVKNFSVVVHIMPSNHNKGFKNGEMVVDCQLED
jgi:hypothetical protein